MEVFVAVERMQDYAHDVASDPTITDPVVNDLANGLKAGVHSRDNEPVYDEHQTVNLPGGGTIHYDEESGTWREYEPQDE